MPNAISVAAWNVNSVKSRLSHLLEYIQSDASPDVLLLQETKTADESFPREAIADAGYNIEIHGQKSYNGVAILSRYPISDVVKGLPDCDDGQARYIEGLIECEDAPIRVASIYMPNGSSPDSPKFAYKMRFMEGLRERLQTLWDYRVPVAVGGDFNAVFRPTLDVHDPALLEGTVCCHPRERVHMHSYANMGWRDLYRAAHPAEKKFSWWDYRGGAKQKNLGLRIDYMLGSPEVADGLQEAHIDDFMREKDTPSDHAPVRVIFAPAR